VTSGDSWLLTCELLVYYNLLVVVALNLRSRSFLEKKRLSLELFTDYVVFKCFFFVILVGFIHCRISVKLKKALHAVPM